MICDHCKQDHDEQPLFASGDPATSSELGNGVVTFVGRTRRGCITAQVKLPDGKTVLWSANWQIKCDPLSTDLRSRPTSELLAMYRRLSLPRPPLKWRGASTTARKAFWHLLDAEIDARIPPRTAAP